MSREETGEVGDWQSKEVKEKVYNKVCRDTVVPEMKAVLSAAIARRGVEEFKKSGSLRYCSAVGAIRTHLILAIRGTRGPPSSERRPPSALQLYVSHGPAREIATIVRKAEARSAAVRVGISFGTTKFEAA